MQVFLLFPVDLNFSQADFTLRQIYLAKITCGKSSKFNGNDVTDVDQKKNILIEEEMQQNALQSQFDRTSLKCKFSLYSVTTFLREKKSV